MIAYVFDLDGVLCRGPHFGVALEREYGIAPALWGDFFQGEFLDCIVGRRDLKTVLLAYLPRIGWPGSVDELLAFWFSRESVICSEALACVRELRGRGHRCYLGTNQEPHRARYIAEEMSLAQEFDAIFASGFLGHAKPSPDFYTAVERRTGSNDLFLIDDSLRNVAAAERAGWRALHYRGPADLQRVRQTARCATAVLQPAPSPL